MTVFPLSPLTLFVTYPKYVVFSSSAGQAIEAGRVPRRGTLGRRRVRLQRHEPDRPCVERRSVDGALLQRTDRVGVLADGCHQGRESVERIEAAHELKARVRGLAIGRR